MTHSTKIIAIFMAMIVLFASCASTTLIQSKPSGAKIYIDGQPVGSTPYTHSDTKIVGSTTTVKLEKEGYTPLNVSFYRDEQIDVRAIVGGIFIWIPLLWIMKYNPLHTYELTPISNHTQSEVIVTKSSETNNSTNELIKLKNLLDLQAITNKDFTTLKVKILNNEYDYSNSIADQMIKLKSLLDATLLTEEEFLQQKNKLIYEEQN